MYNYEEVTDQLFQIEEVNFSEESRCKDFSQPGTYAINTNCIERFDTNLNNNL